MKKVRLVEVVNDFNKIRVPLSSNQRKLLKKIYPYYGAQGIVDYVEDFLFDGEYLLIAEDGENLKSNNQNICNMVKGKFWVNNHAHILQGKKDNLTRYLYYKLNTINFSPFVTGSSQPKLNKENLFSIEFFIHENIKTQRKIAKILSDIDDKIEILHQINDNLAELAKTIYDYWFVQFDFPDENGKPYKSSGGKMVYNDILKREIPEGWEVKRLGEILKKNETTIKINAKDYLSSGSIPIIDQSSDFICGYTNEISALIKASNIPAIIFGDHTRILKFIDFDFARGADGTQILFSNNEKMPQYLFYHSLLKIDLSNYGYARHFKFLKEQKILLSDRLIAEKFTDNIKTIYEKIKINRNQIQHLQSLRDWLLPMLMNGQISVE